MRDRGDDYAYENSGPLKFEDSMSKEDHERHKMEWKLRKRKSTIKLWVLMLVLVGLISLGAAWVAG